MNQKVTGSIPYQGGISAWLVGLVSHVKGKRSKFLSHTDISLRLFLPPFSLSE